MKKTITEYGPETPGYAQLNEQQRQQQQPKKKRQSKSLTKLAAKATKSVLPLFTICILLIVSGCAQSRAGLEREARLEAAIEKAKDFLDKNILPVVPTPYKEALGLLAVGTGGVLAAWNKNQGKRIAALEKSHTKLAATVGVKTSVADS